jgi:hypothetical protein
VREALFDTLDKLRKKEIDIETAKAVQEVSQTILNSAKMELDFLRHTDNVRSKFFDAEEAQSMLQTAKETKQKALSNSSVPKEEIDKTLQEIKDKQSKPYEFGK